MTSTFRLPSEVLVGWKERLAAQRGTADATLQEILRALQTESGDGHVVVQRHQLFSWMQAVEGAALKQPALKPVADDMRATLAGRAAPDAAAPAPLAVPRPAAPPETPLPPPTPTAAPLATATYVPPPPIVYQKGAAPAATSAPGASRIVTHGEVPGFVAEMLRDARTEVLVVSPWGMGLDTLANALLQLPPAVAVRVITRRPAQEDEAYHRLLPQLRKRGFDVVFSQSLMTRMVLTDGQRLLLGAASIPPSGAPVRETALATTDASTVNAAREQFAKLLEEARGGR